MASVVEGLGVDRERLAVNLRGQGIPGAVLAEPAYILLAESGVSDAHEVIRRLTLRAETEGLTFAEVLETAPDVLERIGGKVGNGKWETGSSEEKKAAAREFFARPENYRGLAAEKARSLAEKYRRLMEEANHV
jgi:adenylosuccinate lyase